MKSPHPVFSYRQLVSVLNRTQFRHYQKCTSPWIPLSCIACMFDIRFPILCLVAKARCNTHTILLLSQLVPVASLSPPLLHLSTALTGSSMTLPRTIRILLPFTCAKQTGIWLLLHALTTLPLLSGFCTVWFPSTFFLSVFILSDIFESQEWLNCMRRAYDWCLANS